MIRILFALILAAAVAAPVLSAQDETRQLWDSEFLQKRPAPKVPRKIWRRPATIFDLSEYGRPVVGSMP